MKKIVHILLAFAIFPLIFGFAQATAQETPLHIVYIDKGRSTSTANLSLAMVELLEQKLKETPANAKILLYLSNLYNPEIAKDSKSAEKLVEKLSNADYAKADSKVDKLGLREAVYNADLSGATSIDISFFVTEAYLKDDLLGKSNGLFLNFLPKEVQYLTNVSSSKVVVNVYYPKASAAISQAQIDACKAFAKSNALGGSAMQLEFVPI